MKAKKHKTTCKPEPNLRARSAPAVFLQRFTKSAALLLLLSLGLSCETRGATDVSGTIWGTWTKANAPYNVVGNILTADLTIEEGVEVRFQGNYVFEVGGVLNVKGTTGEPVIFSGVGGGWQGVYFNQSPPGSFMTHCVISNSVNSGVRIRNAVPSFTNCWFVANSGTDNGGGVFATMSSGDLILSGCMFLGNSCASHGGGLAATMSSGKVVITDCLFTGNRANPSERDGGYVGGGISIWGDAELSRCTFDGNSSYSTRNGYDIVGRGGAAYFAGNAVVRNCLFKNNFSKATKTGIGRFATASAHGGAIYLHSGNLLLQNTILADNTLVATGSNYSGYYAGGGLFVNSGICTVVNVTCAYNAAQGIYVGGGSTSITNSILYFNSPEELRGSASVAYSDVRGGYEGPGNIDFHPIFLSRSDLQIVPGSRCIDAGHPDSVFNDACRPPSLGTERNDIGAHGGPGACLWNGTCSAPEIVSQPRSQSSCVGYTATFTVSVTGSEPLSCQWFHDNTLMAGQTTASLTLTNLQAADAGLYTVEISNGCGTVTSTPAALAIYDACVDIHMYAGLSISGQSGQTYVLKYTTDLSNTNFATWMPLATNTMGSSSWFYLDMDSPFSPRRFYGVKLFP